MKDLLFAFGFLCTRALREIVRCAEGVENSMRLARGVCVNIELGIVACQLGRRMLSGQESERAVAENGDGGTAKRDKGTRGGTRQNRENEQRESAGTRPACTFTDTAFMVA